MLKVGLPKAAVIHACHRDHVDPAILDGSAASQYNEEQEEPSTDTHRRTRLHWEPLSRVGGRSVWAILEKDEEFFRLNIDEVEFAELFQQEKESTLSSKHQLGCHDNSSSRRSVNIIEQKRANNGGIVLASLKKSYIDATKDIDEM